MTSPKFSPEVRRRTPLAYFSFLLRQNWPALVTNTIILLLINVVFLSMVLSEELEHQSVNEYLNIINLASSMRIINVVVASLLSVLWGCSALSYVNSKISINFYHSIPLTRGTLYISEILVKLIYFAIPAVITTMLSLFLTGIMSGYWTVVLTHTFFSGLGYSLLYFFFFFSIMIFCATFTGNAFSRLMAAGLVVAMPAALAACINTILEFSAVYSDYDSLLTFAAEIFMPARIIMFLAGDQLETNALREISGALIAALIFFAAGYLIYRKRKSELSGTPVLSKIAAGLIKYSCMFCAASLFGLIFDAFANTFWYFIGALIGALLIMMLINVILTKSAKQMFSGLPALGIFSAAFLLFFVLFGLDVIGYDRYIPSPSLIRSMTIDVDGDITLEVENAEDKEYFIEFLREYIDSGKYTQNNEYPTASVEEMVLNEKKVSYSMDEGTAQAFKRDILVNLMHAERRFSLSVTFEPVVGLKMEKYLYVSADNEFDEFLLRIADSENFAETYIPDSCISENASVEHAYIERLGIDSVSEMIPATVKAVLRQMRDSYNGSAYFQRSTFSSVTYRVLPENSTRYIYLRFPYYHDDPKYMEEFISQVNAVYVLDRETNHVTQYTEINQIRELCNSLVLSSGRTLSPFTLTEDRYSAVIIYGTEDAYARGLSEIRTAFFLDGKMPAWLK